MTRDRSKIKAWPAVEETRRRIRTLCLQLASCVFTGQGLYDEAWLQPWLAVAGWRCLPAVLRDMDEQLEGELVILYARGKVKVWVSGFPGGLILSQESRRKGTPLGKGACTPVSFVIIVTNESA